MKQFTLEEKNQVLENPFIHIHRTGCTTQYREVTNGMWGKYKSNH